MLTESELCTICASSQRDVAQLCVVESPADVVAIEQSGGFRGRYFVLMGHLSPLDGIGPSELGLDEFERLLGDGEVREVILATNPDGGRRGHRALSGRAGIAFGASRRRASPMACRSAANSNTSTAALWRMHWRAAPPSPEVRAQGANFSYRRHSRR